MTLLAAAVCCSLLFSIASLQLKMSCLRDSDSWVPASQASFSTRRLAGIDDFKTSSAVPSGTQERPTCESLSL
jgi:hypothetical protein